MTNHDSQPAIDALALAMMNSFGQLSLILAHMQRYRAEGKSSPDAPEPPFALAELLRQVLQGLGEEHDAADIATAAQMLVSATQIVGDELFVVDVEQLGEF